MVDLGEIKRRRKQALSEKLKPIARQVIDNDVYQLIQEVERQRAELEAWYRAYPPQLPLFQISEKG